MKVLLFIFIISHVVFGFVFSALPPISVETSRLTFLTDHSTDYAFYLTANNCTSWCRFCSEQCTMYISNQDVPVLSCTLNASCMPTYQ